MKSKSAEVKAPVQDGEYENLIDGKMVAVKNGMLRCEGRPVIFCLDR